MTKSDLQKSLNQIQKKANKNKELSDFLDQLSEFDAALVSENHEPDEVRLRLPYVTASHISTEAWK